MASVSGLIAYSVLNQSSTSQEFSFRVANIGQLALDHPDQTFVQNATSDLQIAEFTIDYYPSYQVTLDLYRRLPSLGYGVIILRVHTALSLDGSSPDGLFASEPCRGTKHVYEQLTDQLIEGNLPGYPSYFANVPAFFRPSAQEHFPKSVILLMGCDGLRNTDVAKSFTDKGAQAYRSWSDLVSASHTDWATLRLLQNLFVHKLAISDAVAQTMNEVGPEPTFRTSLLTIHRT